jgi:hypothetical protein
MGLPGGVPHDGKGPTNASIVTLTNERIKDLIKTYSLMSSFDARDTMFALEELLRLRSFIAF